MAAPTYDAVDSVRSLQVQLDLDYDIRIRRMEARRDAHMAAGNDQVLGEWLKGCVADEMKGFPAVVWDTWAWQFGQDHHGLFIQLTSMLSGIAKMDMAVNGDQDKFKAHAGWTLWITNHLRPLSSRTSPAVTLDMQIKKMNESAYSGKPARILQIRADHAESERKRMARVDTKRLALLLNLLPPGYIACMWLDRCKTPAMSWLREDLKEHCTYVHEHFMDRTWLDQSNIARKLDQVRGGADGRWKIPEVLIRRILGLVNEYNEDLPIRNAKVDDTQVLQRQLAEIAGEAGRRTLAQTRADLKRIYDSIVVPLVEDESGDESNKKQRV